MCRAYYNEHEPYAAQWLRNLIAAGHIAPGDVDARDIQEVTPDGLTGYTQCHLGWPTPNAIPAERGGLQTNPTKALERRQQGHMLNLDDAATLAGWPTPDAAAMNVGCDPEKHQARRARLKAKGINGNGAGLTLGAAASLSPAPTAARGGSLNPEFSRWLMGSPARVGQLRAYGNAICPHVAAAFIRVSRDVRMT